MVNVYIEHSNCTIKKQDVYILFLKPYINFKLLPVCSFVPSRNRNPREDGDQDDNNIEKEVIFSLF